MFTKIKNWFVHSETIFWARLQVIAGVIWAVISVADLSPLLSPKALAIWLIINGIISEYLRRRGTDTVTVAVVREEPGEPIVPVTVLESKPIEGAV
jgi:hypothetical protein